VRSWLSNQDPVDARWLNALRDPGLSRTLANIHAHPGTRWTVEKLAELAGMSRAAFARRFTQLVGASPLAYVTSRRLDLAARLLRDSDQQLGEIAAAVGYESEFAMSRAFKRSRNVAPGRYRAMQRGLRA
jgi:transcriptional regulator GlxA family with amidase domain